MQSRLYVTASECLDNNIRLQGKVDFSWGHKYQGVLHCEGWVFGLLSLPYFMKALATDTATQMGMQLDLDQSKNCSQNQDRTCIPRPSVTPL
jgi:hypothetical protein